MTSTTQLRAHADQRQVQQLSLRTQVRCFSRSRGLARLVLIELACWADPTERTVRRSIDELAQWLLEPTSAIVDALKDLLELGEIQELPGSQDHYSLVWLDDLLALRVVQ